MDLSMGEVALFEFVSDVLFFVPSLLCFGFPNVLYSEIYSYFLSFTIFYFVLLFELVLE